MTKADFLSDFDHLNLDISTFDNIFNMISIFVSKWSNLRFNNSLV